MPPIGAARAGVSRVAGTAIPDSALDHYLPSNFDDGTNEWAGDLGNYTLSATAGDPSLATSDINGEDAVHLNGDDVLQSADFSTPVSQPVTHLGVFRLLDDFRYPFGSTTGDFQAIQSADPDWRMGAGTQLEGGSYDTSYHVYAVIFDGADSVLRIDGANSLSGDAGTNAFDGISLGTQATSGVTGEVYWAEYLPCDADLRDTGELSTQEQRVANKYDITLA